MAKGWAEKVQTQQDQPARVTSPLGDQLLLAGFIAAERLSEPFTISLDVLAEKEIDFIQHLGSGFGVDMTEDARLARPFNGVLFEAQHVSDDDEGVRYRLTLRPWTLLLDTGLNTRLWQDKSARDIIKAVFEQAGLSGFEFRLRGDSKPRHYCVQYRESDFEFVSRLMEEEGYFYFFEHEPAKHTLVIADDASAHKPVPGMAELEYTSEGGKENVFAHLTSWAERVRPGVQKVSLRDSHFMKPFDAYAGEADTTGQGANDKAELYDYPGAYSYVDDTGARREGSKVAGLLLEASRAERRLMEGSGNAFALAVGSRVKIKDHPHGPYNEEVRVLGAVHSYTGQAYATGGGSGVDMSVSIEATPIATPWRPPLRTAKPVVQGPQTAIVVGPDEAKGIHVDKYGRVRVKFYWDRRDKGPNGQEVQPDHRSCWVRVAQGWADGGFGAMHIPRVGEEVVVSFLEGDPDRPIVTGRVYNAERMPPYALPAEKTKSTWKSQTVGDSGQYQETEEPPAGNEKGFNELRFEDKGGSEEVFLHAQRDYKAWVRHDESRKTGRDVTVRVGRSRKTEVKKDETLIVETGSEVHTVKAGSRKTTINKADELKIETGDKKLEVSMGNWANQVKMGNYTLKCDLGKVTVEAMQEIELKVGMNSIKISQMGVEIKGMMVNAKADIAMTVEGLKTDVKANAMLTANGPIVMIN
jgi:type VI secretion system secreted protein VgrG